MVAVVGGIGLSRGYAGRPAETAAAFVTTDGATQGDWPGRYGTLGYLIPVAGSAGLGASSVRTRNKAMPVALTA